MTDPERPAERAPGNPTPEEISARLEALLKRTHTLRTERAARAASDPPVGMTWPPPDRELAHYDVVDTADGETSPAEAADAARPAATPASTTSASETPRDGTFTSPRPDWSDLRLRPSAHDQPSSTSWLWVAAVLLGLIAAGEAAYIWYLRSDKPAALSGRLRVDAPDGADVRVDGRSIGTAPVDHELEPGGYTVDIVQSGGVAHVSDVIIGLGRTVVVAIPGVSASPTTAAADTPAPPLADGPGQMTPPAATTGDGRPASAPAVAAEGTVSPTLGAVAIESTPTGLPVTMGGRPRGVTPITIGLIRPGRHDVMVGRALRQVDIVANEVVTLRVP